MRWPGVESFGLIVGALGLAILLVVLGVWMIKRGLRRTIAPSCRRCGYNVSHRPADSTLCSECGADLTGRKSIRTHRRGGTAWATLPFTLALLTALYIAPSAWRFQWRAWYVGHAPTSLVIYHATSSPGIAADDLRLEWNRRRIERQQLIEHLLAIQMPKGNLRSTMAPMLLGQALLNGELTPAQTQRYFDQVFHTIQLDVEPRVRRDEPIPFKVRLRANEARGAFDYEFDYAMTVDSPPSYRPRRPTKNDFIPSGLEGKASHDAWGNVMPTLGPHTLRVVARVRLLHPRSMTPVSPWLERSAEAKFELIPADRE